METMAAEGRLPPRTNWSSTRCSALDIADLLESLFEKHALRGGCACCTMQTKGRKSVLRHFTEPMAEPSITHLERRKIEAGVLIPMVQAFQRAVGQDRAHEVTREVILALARKDGERGAERFGTEFGRAGTGRWPLGGWRQSRHRASG